MITAPKLFSVSAGVRPGTQAGSALLAFANFLPVTLERQFPHQEGLYFITITWALSGFGLRDNEWLWHCFTKWFDHVKTKGHLIYGYVIMPNHLHAMIAFRCIVQSINSIVGNGKRFMPMRLLNDSRIARKKFYWIDWHHTQTKQTRWKGQLHEVFEPSSIGRSASGRSLYCRSWIIFTRIHTGRLEFGYHPQDYEHSSAGFYMLNQQGKYEVINYKELWILILPWVLL